jgi:hypothetical protein
MDYNKIINLVYETLPHRIDITPKGEYKPKSEIGEEGYIENEEGVLMINHQVNMDSLSIYYYGDDDSYHYLHIDVSEATTRTELIVALSESLAWIEELE